jgi:hypothetical protein
LHPFSREAGSEPHIVAIEKLWKEENDGEMWLRGNWFLRPKETYHVAKKKFLEKEVFKSDFSDSVPFSKMVGKCFVMSVKEYYKLKPEVRMILEVSPDFCSIISRGYFCSLCVLELLNRIKTAIRAL